MSKFFSSPSLKIAVTAASLSLSDAVLPGRSVEASTQDNNGALIIGDRPVISNIQKADPSGDMALTIQDPPGVLSYNIEFANALISEQGESFNIAEENVPVSGIGETVWIDNGSFTVLHPGDPAVRTRFYRVEVDQIINMLPLVDRVEHVPAIPEFYNFNGSKTVFLVNNGDTDLHWSVATDQPWLSTDKATGVIPCRANVQIDSPYHLAGEWKSFNPAWDFKDSVGIGVRNDNKVFVLDDTQNLIKIFDLSGDLLHSINYGGINSISHIAFDSSDNFYISKPGGVAIFSSSGELQREIGQGVCNNVFDIAVNSQGEIFVTDGGSLKVHKFDNDGTHLLSWSSDFWHPSKMSGIMGIVIDSADNVYVADNHYLRIQKFNSQGDLLKTWGQEATSSDYQLGEVFTIDRYNRIYIAHEHSSKITILNSNLGQIGEVTPTYGMDGNQYMRDAGVSQGGVIYSVEEDGGVYGFNASGEVSTWDNKSSTDLAFRYNENFKFDSKGNVYFVGDDYSGNHELRKYNASGNLLKKITLNGYIDEMIAIDSQDRIYIDGSTYKELDVYNENLQKIDSISLDNLPFSSAGGIGIDNNDLICILPGYYREEASILVKIDREGNLIEEWQRPANIELNSPESVIFDSSGNAYILTKYAETYGDMVSKFDSSGTLIQNFKPADMTIWTSFDVDSDDNLYLQTKTGFRKYDKHGTQVLSKTFTPTVPSSINSLFEYLRIAPNGDVFVFYDRPGQMAVYSQAAAPVSISVDHDQLDHGDHVGAIEISDIQNPDLDPLAVPVEVKTTKYIP